ncbi:hypothetical protein SBA3_3920002 [Candidatus Sulfopaludibacter sp. SbA3]|nr:hypothetical protein SBA3_3920002 [Candidatus Sulfopaludibacter sp. SbA3]
MQAGAGWPGATAKRLMDSLNHPDLDVRDVRGKLQEGFVLLRGACRPGAIASGGGCV